MLLYYIGAIPLYLPRTSATTTAARHNDFPFENGVFWGPRGCYIFLNKIFNYLKGNCVLRTLKNSFAIFWTACFARSLAAQKIASLFFGRDGHTYTHTHTHTHKVRAD